MIVVWQCGRRRPGRPGAAPRGEVGGGRAPRHRAGRAGTQPGPARGARGPGANLLDLDLDLGRRVLVVRKAERAVRCGSKRDASAGRHGEISRCRAPLHRSTSDSHRPTADVELYSSTALSTALYSSTALQRSTLYILYTLPPSGGPGDGGRLSAGLEGPRAGGWDLRPVMNECVHRPVIAY